MFELEPLIAAEPDSPEKHRALARVYAALGRYQSAFTHFQATANRQDPQDRADFAYLQNLAQSYGDDKQRAERPLPITPELKASLPAFKYCPDPLVSGIFRTQEKAVACDCCQRDTHVFYTHPFYSYDDIEALCPECIAGGRATEELEGEFVIRDDVSQAIGKAQQDELCLRTPSYSSCRKRNGQTTAATTAPLSAMPAGKTCSGKASLRASNGWAPRPNPKSAPASAAAVQ